MSSPGNKKQVSYIRRVAHLFILFILPTCRIHVYTK